MSYHLGQIDPEERTGLYADPRDEEADPPPRRVLRIVGALLIMALFAGGLWFAYVEGARHMAGTGGSGDIPLIRADTRPMKVKPAEPGGMPIPDRDMLIYGQNRPMVEHLLPPPEQPMALPAPPPPAATSAAQAPAGASQAVAPPAVAPGSDTAPAVAAARPEQSAGLPPQIRVRCPRNRRKRRPNQNSDAAGKSASDALETGGSGIPTSNSGRGAASARRGAQRGSCARGMGAHQAEQPGFAGPPDGGGDSRRPRRQRRLLPYPGGAGRGPGDR